MPYSTPSTPAIDHPHPVLDTTRTLVCLSCGDTMKHLRTLPKLGMRAEKLIFVCPSCKEVDTKELISTRHETASNVPNHSTFQNP